MCSLMNWRCSWENLWESAGFLICSQWKRTAVGWMKAAWHVLGFLVCIPGRECHGSVVLVPSLFNWKAKHSDFTMIMGMQAVVWSTVFNLSLPFVILSYGTEEEAMHKLPVEVSFGVGKSAAFSSPFLFQQVRWQLDHTDCWLSPDGVWLWWDLSHSSIALICSRMEAPDEGSTCLMSAPPLWVTHLKKFFFFFFLS